ncbi:MAG: WYL domain-containing protein [bacterium]|nr:WYL domain-containing protein [bacterium]
MITNATQVKGITNMERASNKAGRLLQIEALLLAYPEGLTQSEIARRLQVNRSTINRYLPDLDKFSIHETGDGKLAIDRDHYLANVRLTMHEAMAVHLAARLMATRTDKHNPHAASALRKLGLSLEKLAPLISAHLIASAEVMDDEARRHDPVYQGVLETLTRAWSLGRKLWLKHQMSDQRVFEYVFAPYFIEPYAVGQTSHVIGWREPPGALRTFKIERIKAARILDQPYTIPADFDPREKLADAWGIWYTEAQPVEVVLRFHPRVARRVRETRWHHSESVDEQPDGSLLWRAWVAEPREMLPWIRGWGADVEVVKPVELRERMVGETRRLAETYGWQVGQGDTAQDDTLDQTFASYFGA